MEDKTLATVKDGGARATVGIDEAQCSWDSNLESLILTHKISIWNLESHTCSYNLLLKLCIILRLLCTLQLCF